MSEVKGVLLRFRGPAGAELLARVDEARGALTRTDWLMDVISHALDELELSSAPTVVDCGPTDMLAGAVRMPRRVVDADGSDLGLRASSREDGVLEIEAASPTDTPPERGGPDGEPIVDTADALGELEGPDVSSPHSSETPCAPRSAQGGDGPSSDGDRGHAVDPDEVEGSDITSSRIGLGEDGVALGDGSDLYGWEAV